MAIVVRNDFSDDGAWKAVCALLEQPSANDRFRAYLDFVDDPSFDGATVEDIRSRVLQGITFIFVVDHEALSNPEHPVLVVDLYDEPGRTFRVIPSEAWGVENNLSIANMDFSEFADAVDSEGVFRGFA